MTQGSDMIGAERQRQIEAESYTAEHDRGHSVELEDAAACYLWAEAAQRGTHAADFEEVEEAPMWWPWDDEFWKPSRDRVKNLVRAGALIAAAIDAEIVQGTQSSGPK